MFATQRILSSVLIALTAAIGPLSAMSVCDVNGDQCCSQAANHSSPRAPHNRCCGARSGSEKKQHSCCQLPESTRVCTCSAENDQPVIPSNERRDSDERQSTRSESRSVDGVASVGEANAALVESKNLFASLTTVRRHAILCCWLT